ncbi:hypothetical protein AYI70_g9598, partial [Smittium culicis]
MCPYAFSQCPEGPASGPDTLLEGLESGFAHSKCLPTCCEHIRPSQEAVGSVYSLPDLILVVLDRPRYIPFAIHNIAQVGVLVGGVDFLALQGHISGQLPAYSHYPALGGIHSHFPSVRPFGYGVQCDFSPGMRETIGEAGHPCRTPLSLVATILATSFASVGISEIPRDDVGDGSAITSFHTSDGTPSAPGALLFGVSASAPVISDHSMVLSHS